MWPELSEPGDSGITYTGEQVRPDHLRAALEKFLLTLDKQTSEVHDPHLTKKGLKPDLCLEGSESHTCHTGRFSGDQTHICKDL